MIKDPWTVSTKNLDEVKFTSNTVTTEFEDNFEPSVNDNLPDSKEYLDALEKRLQKLKTNTSVLNQLSQRREQCMESLLRGNITLPTDADFGLLDSPDTEQSPNDIIRHIIPQRAINPGELVHIINYDQLEQADHVEGDSNEESRQAEQ